MSRTNIYLDRVSQVITQFRGDDPTAPVTILVSTVAEAEALRLTLARSSDPVLRIGVAVQPVRVVACHGYGSASAQDIQDCVREVLGTTHFASLQGLPGVVSTLAGCVDLWDQALPAQREALLPDRASGDAARLWGLADLYDKVCNAVEARGLVMPATAAEQLAVDTSALWIDSTVSLPSPATGAWLKTLGQDAQVERVLPGEDWTPTDEEVLSAVDPVDEAGRAARQVTGLLESGIAARDIAVVAPAGELERYRSLVTMGLEDAGVPFDGADSCRYATTHPGRLIAAAISAINAIVRPRDLTFDHIRDLILAGGVKDAADQIVKNDRLVVVWEYLRGTDPAEWSGIQGSEDAAAEDVVRSVARLLTLAAVTDEARPAWTNLAEAFAPVLDSCLIVDSEDGAARQAFATVLTRWSSRTGLAHWAEARDELMSVLTSGRSSGFGGVRCLPLEAGWAACAKAVVAVGLSDDLLPGIRNAVGPLAAHEVLALLVDEADRGLLARDGERQFAALGACTGSLALSYSRSDLLRTIVRQSSRFLAAVSTRDVEFVMEQAHQVANGDLGLLGPVDAAAARLHAGQRAVITRSLDEAVACTQSRLEPPAQEGVDAYNGDLSALPQELQARLSPDIMRGDPQDPTTSPSRLEKLLGCPAGWWASCVLGVDDPQLWDPAQMDAAARGSWLHEALQILESRHRLAQRSPGRHAIEEALWDAVGGRPEAGTHPHDSDVKLHGFRHRIDAQDVAREVNVLVGMIERLAVVLQACGIVDDQAETETPLGPEPVPLDSGDLYVGGRVDRIDVKPDDDIIVTDYKSGAAGSGFQLAVYAWLRLLGRDACAEVLYARAANAPYEPHSLLGDEALDPLRYSRVDLEQYLVSRLAEPVGLVRSGRISSAAWSKEHDRYCLLCSDLRPAKGSWGSSNRGGRAVALSGAVAVDEGSL